MLLLLAQTNHDLLGACGGLVVIQVGCMRDSILWLILDSESGLDPIFEKGSGFDPGCHI